ncbi:hypothetical protein CCUS01_11615 [Colletotrichum cuscutae]|uniref:Uncharacterized protein n=1 Tax=Colletotrichum cuscutae TaxID=1209917 RepID=A0AAI9U152_9PEZI|nr:hypothetical protein CCUS01_11615 [Colletotrichum cuscutae]
MRSKSAGWGEQTSSRQIDFYDEQRIEEARRLWRKRSLQKPDVASRTQVKVGGYSGDHLETKGYLDAGAVDRSPSGRLLIRCIEERSADDSDSSKCSKVFSLG